jgi:hypothetical protein
MFCIELWGFSIDPPYLGYNYVEHKMPVLRILMFQGPFRTQNEVRLFLESLFFPEQQYETKEHTSRTMRLKRAYVAGAFSQGAPPEAVCPSRLRCHTSSSQIDHLDLKSSI